MDNKALLFKLCLEGIEKKQNKFSDHRSVYFNRLKMEYDMITELGYTDYFLIVWDIVRWAKENNILVGMGRGSVNGSLLAYLIDITQVDPVKYDLMFERFMNPTRSKFDPPDIDLDFQASRRDEVKEYIANKYGSDRVCGIGAYTRGKASTTIRDVARVMDLDISALNSVIANKLYGVTLREAYLTIPEFSQWVEANDQRKRCYELAKGLEGLVRHKTVHPSGLIVTLGDITDYVPLMKVKDVVCTQWRDVIVAKRGILKLDILGLSALDIIDKIKRSIKTDIDFSSIEPDDPAVLRMFTDGNVTGVFQFDAFYLRRIIKDLGADSFEDLIIATTIARPGVSNLGITDSVIRRKQGKEKLNLVHKSVESLLSPTYGYPIYQEQVMKMANQIGNIPLHDTEVMRAAMKKKDADVISAYKEQFLAGAKANNIPNDAAGYMWNVIDASSAYGFNRSHAVAYSLLGYYMAYLKHHYPLEFTGACLSQETDSKKIYDYISEARRLGIKILPADVNKSDLSYSVESGGIRAGLTNVKHVGIKSAIEIKSKRPYKDKNDLISKVNARSCNKRVIESLEKAGVFDLSEADPQNMLYYYGFMLNDKVASLDLADLSNCDKCNLCEKRCNVVSGEGVPNADIMFVGEAPGYSEDMQGRPFVGKAGIKLRAEWCPELGIVPIDAYITNAVKCAPKTTTGHIGKPTDDNIAVCSLWLDKEIETVKPKIIVSLGSTALRALSSERSVMAHHGKTFDVFTRCGGKKDAIGFSLYHPAYFLYRNTKEMVQQLRDDLNILKKLILEVNI